MAGLYPRSLACSILLSMKASSAGLAVRLVPIRAAYRNGRRGAIQGVGFQTETLPRTLSVPVRGLEFLRRTKNADRCPHLRSGPHPWFATMVLPRKPGPGLTGPCRHFLRTVRNADPPQAARTALAVRAVARHRIGRRL